MDKPVVQKHLSGCGIACVAYVLRQSYDKTLGFFDAGQAEERGFYCKELVAVLQQNGRGYTYKYLKPRLRRQIYHEGVIVFIKRSKRYPPGHYLVRAQGQWMDPWINFPKDSRLTRARGGWRKRLPGRPIYALFPA